MFSWKIAPALATGNTIVIKPSEITPLTALRMASLIAKAGFPPGVVNILVGYGHTVGEAITSHMRIDKVAFTGSTLTGRKIMEACARSNLKNVTLELGGKSPNVIFGEQLSLDCERNTRMETTTMSQMMPTLIRLSITLRMVSCECLYALLMFGVEEASKSWNHGQTCCAGSRIYVQSGVYDEFLKKFTEKALSIKVGDPFGAGTYQGPQVSQTQFDVCPTFSHVPLSSISPRRRQRVMGYVESGKADGAKVHVGGERHGTAGYFIQPTIFTNTRPDMKIVSEEIFGPVGVVIKFDNEEGNGSVVVLV